MQRIIDKLVYDAAIKKLESAKRAAQSVKTQSTTDVAFQNFQRSITDDIQSDNIVQVTSSANRFYRNKRTGFIQWVDASIHYIEQAIAFIKSIIR